MSNNAQTEAVAVAVEDEPTLSKLGNQKPVVLSSERYNKILNQSMAVDHALAQQEAEGEYREYLKKGSDDLVARFTGNLKRTQEQKLEELKKQSAKKIDQDQELVERTKENEINERREKLAKAHQLIEKLKQGPRELRSAALQSEVLRARNVQRTINEEFAKSIKKQECADKLACDQQAMPWIGEEQQRIQERQVRTNNYKQELMQTINENSKQRTEVKQQELKEQTAAREAMDREIKSQIDKERCIMEKKRAVLRKNALEAMRMVEQRRQRELMADEVEDRLCCVYNGGKHHLNTLKKEQIKKIASDREKAIEANAKYSLSVQPNVPEIEEERRRRDISRMELKFTAEEREKVRKDKAAKQARIESYLRDLESQKMAKYRAEEEKRFYMAQRFKNTEINNAFNANEKQERLRKIQAMRNQLDQQTIEEKCAERKEKELLSRECDNKHEKDDQFFFEYARNLMEDAQKKERPLYPFVKVVQQYKRKNDIECERKTPKHLMTNLSLVARQPGDCDYAHKTAVKAQQPNKDIVENCLKITELLGAAAGSGDLVGSGGSGDGGSKKCDTKCPLDCNYRAQRSNGLAEGGTGDCAALMGSGKVRYSMHELRKLNSAAPSLH